MSEPVTTSSGPPSPTPPPARYAAGLARPVLTKVSEATAAFWIIKVLTTGMGEVVADDAAERYGLAIAGVAGGLLMVIALIWQFRQNRYRPVPYWLAAASISVFGTTIGDAPRRYLGWTHLTNTIVFVVVVLVVLAAWYATERTLSIHEITSRRREGFYWATVGATFALGTAAGDLATNLGSPFLLSALIFAALMGLALVTHKLGLIGGVLAFWFAYVMTRPLGASIADWSWVPQPFGAGWGKPLVATVSSIAFVAVLAWIAATRNGEPKKVTASA